MGPADFRISQLHEGFTQFFQQLFIFINQTRSESDIRIGKAMEKACRKYFGLTLNFSGYVEQHEGVRESVLRRKPVTLDKPESLMSQQLKTIAEHLLKSSNISTPLTPKYSRLIP